ncbi:Tripartite motif-containing protein 2 isoform X2 [Oopsacas minuta]|uniref:Tripartite motif-containing protein 2 isoform X2 n=1 Tax=Oopsacas minuta TaxID=111878 RepID=A0AAV7K6N5_9METZ|nr:Tripartite motif-containing protein 2 isoform X2 [Oopsacas minuta]
MDLDYSLKKQPVIAVGERGRANNELYYARDALFQFSDLKVIRAGTRGSRKGELNNPLGLNTHYNGDLYVVDSNNNRVCIYSKELKFQNCLHTRWLISPKDVKVTPDSIVVMDHGPNCVHFYTRVFLRGNMVWFGTLSSSVWIQQGTFSVAIIPITISRYSLPQES